MIWLSFNAAARPTNSRSDRSGSLRIIFVFVFLITAMSKSPGAWSAIINPSPYVRISAIEFASISTDFPSRFDESELCSVEVLFNRLCASSKTVKCFRQLLFSSCDAMRYSCIFITSSPIIRDFVSTEPTLLKSTITLESNNSSGDNSFEVSIRLYIPFVNDLIRVHNAPV